MTLTTLLIVVMLVLVAMLAGGWWLATRVKRGLDEGGGVPAGGVPRTVTVRPACAAQIRRLSTEPLLFQRAEGDLRIQVGDRPLKPLASLPDRDVRAALREAAVAIDVSFGSRWTAIVGLAADAALRVTRLA